MGSLFAMAVKDLRLLTRNRGSLFFTLFWPLLVALLFGAIFSGGGDGSAGRMRIAVVDEDGSPSSQDLVARLSRAKGLEVTVATRPEAVDLVRRGRRQAYVAIPRGYGERSRRLFYGPTREVELGIDPSRKAEAAMMEGILMQHAAAQMQDTLGDASRSQQMVDEALASLKQADGAAPAETERFLQELKAFLRSPAGRASSGGDGQANAGVNWQPLAVTSQPVEQQRSGPANAFAFTLPQGAVWGLVGCAATFAVSLVTERTRGTLVRLQMAPLSRIQVLGGKALACFLAALAVQVMVFAVGALAFKVRPGSVALLAAAVLSACMAFVGIMMLLSVLGRTEEAAGGSAWAVMLMLSMIGGGMVPLFAMPRWMAQLSDASPVKWAILAMEGAIWRGFTPAEMVLPCGILLAVGAVCFAVGARSFRTM
jgi:ABC-2 type transport system permease protein